MKLPHTLAPVLDKIARQAVGKDWPLYAALLAHWGEIVGEAYATRTTPVKINFPHGKKTDEKWAAGRTGGTLTVRLPQGLAMEMGFHAETIKSRVNGYFGYASIDRIAFETYYAPARPMEKETKTLSKDEQDRLLSKVNSIDNNELRDALYNLGRSVETDKE